MRMAAGDERQGDIEKAHKRTCVLHPRSLLDFRGSPCNAPSMINIPGPMGHSELIPKSNATAPTEYKVLKPFNPSGRRISLFSL